MAADWLHISAQPAGQDVAGVRRVRGEASRTRAGLFTEWAQVLEFPSYFGHNWDAFADVLTDLPEPLTVEVAGADALLADEPPGQLAILLHILARAGEHGLRVVLTAPQPRLAALRDRVAGAMDPP